MPNSYDAKIQNANVVHLAGDLEQVYLPYARDVYVNVYDNCDDEHALHLLHLVKT